MTTKNEYILKNVNVIKTERSEIIKMMKEGNVIERTYKENGYFNIK